MLKRTWASACMAALLVLTVLPLNVKSSLPRSLAGLNRWGSSLPVMRYHFSSPPNLPYSMEIWNISLPQASSCIRRTIMSSLILPSASMDIVPRAVRGAFRTWGEPTFMGLIVMRSANSSNVSMADRFARGSWANLGNMTPEMSCTGIPVPGWMPVRISGSTDIAVGT